MTGFQLLQQDLFKLQKFAETNQTGFRKILKKWDKRHKSTTKEIYLKCQVDPQPCFSHTELTRLADLCLSNIVELERFTGDSDQFELPETELAELLEQGNVQLIMDFVSSSPSKDVMTRLFLRYCSEASVDCLQVMLDTGLVDCNYQDDINMKTCIHEAVLKNDMARVDLFVRHGSLHSGVDLYGRTALHYAAQSGYTKIAGYLLSKGAKVDSIDHDNYTPLVWAVVGGHSGCVELLISNHAAINPISSHAPNPLCLACSYGYKDIVTLLLDRSAEVIPSSAEGMFPIHLASRNGHAHIVSQLIARNANVEEKDSFYGWSPIFFAAQEGHFECVHALLLAGAMVRVFDHEMWLPLTYALYFGHKDVAELLQSQNAMQVIPAQVKPKFFPPVTPSGLFAVSNTEMKQLEMELDDIPSFSLPPPMIPLCIYGHDYLDGKIQINIAFNGAESVVLYGSRSLNSLKLTLKSSQDSQIPYSRTLPFTSEEESATITVDDLKNLSLTFDLVPSFGSHFIGRALVISSQLSNALDRNKSGSHGCELFSAPILDASLVCIGEIKFTCSIITPFQHPGLSIGGATETYWKSTTVVSGAANVSHTLITSSSLSDEYIELVVQYTKDGVCVIYPDWYIMANSFKFGVSNLTYEQASHFISSTHTVTPSFDNKSHSDIVTSIYGSFMTLEAALDVFTELI